MLKLGPTGSETEGTLSASGCLYSEFAPLSTTISHKACATQTNFSVVDPPRRRLARRRTRSRRSIATQFSQAAAAVLDRADVFVERFVEMTKRNPSNVHWWNWGPANEAPVLPHVRMYEEAMHSLLIEQDLTVFKKTRLAVLMARAPWWLGGKVGTTLALLLAGLEELLIDSSGGFLRPLAARFDCGLPLSVF